MGFTQPLWRGRGPYITKINITIARATKRQQDYNVRDAIMRLLVTAEQAYWDVISARENLKVNMEALKLAEAALERTNREIELGATSELERFQPEQNAATARINVTRTEYQLRAFEDALRRQIGADLDPDVRNLPIVLTEDVSKMPEPVTYDREKLVQLALENRPDIKARSWRSTSTTSRSRTRSTRSSPSSTSPAPIRPSAAAARASSASAARPSSSPGPAGTPGA